MACFGKSSVMLLAREALLLGGGGHIAVHDDRSGTVVVEAPRCPECAFNPTEPLNLEERIYERCHR